MKTKNIEIRLIITTLISAFVMKIIGHTGMSDDFKLIQTISTVTSAFSLVALCIFYFKTSSSALFKVVQFLFILTSLGSMIKIFHWSGASIMLLIGLSSVLITSISFIKNVIDQRKNLGVSNILVLVMALFLLSQMFFVFSTNIEYSKQVNFAISGIGILLFAINKECKDLIKATNILSLQSLFVVFSLMMKWIIG